MYVYVWYIHTQPVLLHVLTLLVYICYIKSPWLNNTIILKIDWYIHTQPVLLHVLTLLVYICYIKSPWLNNTIILKIDS